MSERKTSAAAAAAGGQPSASSSSSTSASSSSSSASSSSSSSSSSHSVSVVSPSLVSVSAPITGVQLDGLVLLKILSHARENLPENVTGQLLGLDVDGTLEVTCSFPIPTGLPESDHEAYQFEMMKLLRTVNVEHNTVGWYQSAALSSAFNVALIDAQYTYQKQIPASVVVIYDPFQTSKGRLVIKAFRLTPAFMQMYEKNQYHQEAFHKFDIDSTSIFQEVPIKVHNSHLVHGFLYELRNSTNWNCDSDRLFVSHSSNLEKQFNTLSTLIDDYTQEQGKYQFYQRQLARQKQAQASYLAKRQSENEIRSMTGKDPLPEEDVSKLPIFKPLNKPQRLETYLISNQMQQHVSQINSVTAAAFNKLYLVEAIHKENTAQTLGAAAAAATSAE